MRVWVVSELHRAEGTTICWVQAHEPSLEDIGWAKKATLFTEQEFDKWCTIEVECFTVVEKVAAGGVLYGQSTDQING